MFSVFSFLRRITEKQLQVWFGKTTYKAGIHHYLLPPALNPGVCPSMLNQTRPRVWSTWPTSYVLGHVSLCLRPHSPLCCVWPLSLPYTWQRNVGDNNNHHVVSAESADHKGGPHQYEQRGAQPLEQLSSTFTLCIWQQNDSGRTGKRWHLNFFVPHLLSHVNCNAV